MSVILMNLFVTKDVIKKLEKEDQRKVIKVINKIDLNSSIKNQLQDIVYISAKEKKGLEELKDEILDFTNLNSLSNNNTIITNQRHFDQLNKTLNELDIIVDGLSNDLSSELLSINIKQSLFHLGLITGEVSTDDLLANIFGKFCIGK